MKPDNSDSEQDREVPDDVTTLNHPENELDGALGDTDPSSNRQRWTSHFAAARSMVTSVLVLVVIVCVLWSAIMDLLSQAWLVHPIQVPASLVDQGFYPAVAARHLKDRLRTIQDGTSKTSKGRSQLPLLIDSERKHDIQVPGVGFSLSSVLDYIRPVIGVAPPVISGEIFKVDDELRLRIRITTEHGKFIDLETSSKDGILELFDPAARQIMKELDPLTLSQYLLKEDPEQLLPAITACFHNDSLDDDVKALVVWGQLLLDQKEYDLAKGKAEEALKINSEYAKAYVLKADVHFNKGQLKIALKLYQEALSRNSKDAYAVNAIGLIFLEQKKYADAEDQFRKAVVLRQKESIVHNNLGEALRMQFRNDEAIESYTAAIRLDPDNVMPYYNWGLLHEDAKRFDKAIEYFKKAIEIESASDQMTKWHDRILEELSKLEEAKK